MEEVISHYKAGGRTIKKKEFAGIGSENQLKSKVGLAESVVQVNTVWNFRAKKVVRVQEKQV